MKDETFVLFFTPTKEKNCKNKITITSMARNCILTATATAIASTLLCCNVKSVTTGHELRPR